MRINILKSAGNLAVYCLYLVICSTICYQEALAAPPSMIDTNTAKTIPRNPTQYTQPNPQLLIPPQDPVPQIFSGPDRTDDNTILVKKVNFHGNTKITNIVLQTLVQEFIDRPLDVADLEELRYKVTKYYINSGYINSGATIAAYDSHLKHLTIQITEGYVGTINVQGLTRLKPKYIQDRLRIAGTEPLHLPTLQDRLLVMLNDPMIKSIRGGILPSPTFGAAILTADVIEQKPYSINLQLDNHSPVSLGEQRILLNGILRNNLGFGERLNFIIDGSRGNRHGYLELDFPINAIGTRVYASVEEGAASVIEEPLDVLEIKSTSKNIKFGLTHPLINTSTRNLNLGLSLGYTTTKNTLLNAPFDFSPGSVDGKTRVAPLQFSQEWGEQGADFAYTLRSVLSFGLNGFNVTPTSGPQDAKFTSWLIQQSYIQRLSNSWQILGRLDLQLADSHLPPTEQVSAGGANTIRGYRENSVIRDQILISSLEFRYAILEPYLASRFGTLEGAVFTDFSRSWNATSNAEYVDLHSVGLGLLWNWRNYVQTQLYWGRQLKNSHINDRGTWQDSGIHAQIVLSY
ncbi:hypothetical protein TI04_03975 [Achromatium sp. WMS2]|nr:hypothetical protein TI04_03975 [Achromatium sp. WMS2]